MAINEKEKDGKTVFEVRINVRSKVDSTKRVQKYRGGIPTLRDAKRIEKDLLFEASVELGRKEGTGVKWAELLEKWEHAQTFPKEGMRKLQSTTVWDFGSLLRTYTASWMKKNCSEITPGDVRQVLDIMNQKGLSLQRKRNFRTSVNSVFNWGLQENLVRGCNNPPTLGVELGKNRDETPPEILNLEEIQTLLEAARSMDHEWYFIWAMALNTGMRSGELQALEWSDIDFENKLVTVSKSYNGRQKLVKCTKAGYWRKVPMNSDLENLLIELRAKAKHGEVHVLPRITKWKRGEAAKVLREFCLGIGIPSVRFHALRACFATHLLNAGTSSPIVKKICGWSDEKVMARYIRLAGVDVKGATQALNFIKPEVATAKLVNMADFRRDPNKG